MIPSQSPPGRSSRRSRPAALSAPSPRGTADHRTEPPADSALAAVSTGAPSPWMPSADEPPGSDSRSPRHNRNSPRLFAEPDPRQSTRVRESPSRALGGHAPPNRGLAVKACGFSYIGRSARIALNAIAAWICHPFLTASIFPPFPQKSSLHPPMREKIWIVDPIAAAHRSFVGSK
jgi:hypothetical protein